MIDDLDDKTGSLARLARELDQSVVRCFIRQEMWAFLCDMGWTTGDEPPPLRQREAIAPTAPSDSATARFRAESELLRTGAPPSQTAATTAPVSDGKTRAQQLRERLGMEPAGPLDDDAPAVSSPREGS